MKTITIYGLTAILLLGLTMSAFAQSDMDAARRQMMANLEKQAWRYDILNGHNASLGVLQLLSHDYVREGIGLSEEQAQKIHGEVMGTSILVHMQNDPEYLPLKEEIEKNNPWLPDATEETLTKYADLQGRMDEIVPRQHLRLIDENLTPEQKKKFYEFHISYMSETEYIFPGMFEALDLSDEQRKQFGDVQKNMEPELEKHIDLITERWSKWEEKLDEKVKALTNPEEREKLRMDIIGGKNDIAKQIWAELQPETDKIMESSKKLADELKVEMFDVLTDEQWERLLELIDNPPDYVKRVIAQRRAEREQQKKANASSSGWQPGPNSWKPGDPVPEGYRQERQERSRFSRETRPSP